MLVSAESSPSSLTQAGARYDRVAGVFDVLLADPRRGWVLIIGVDSPEAWWFNEPAHTNSRT